MEEKCIDEKIGRQLKLLDYSFNKSLPEKKEIYKQHLDDCKYCSIQAVKAKSKRRLKGVLNILGGIGLMLASLFIPIPLFWIVVLLSGIVWLFIGIWRLVSGKD